MNFLEKSTVAFKHLYLQNWTPSFETLPYPPASGPYAVYTIPEFYSMVNYAQTRVNVTTRSSAQITVGATSFVTSQKWGKPPPPTWKPSNMHWPICRVKPLTGRRTTVFCSQHVIKGTEPAEQLSVTSLHVESFAQVPRIYRHIGLEHSPMSHDAEPNL